MFVDGRPVETKRYVLKIFLPSGHTVGASCTRTEFQKVMEIAKDYPAPPETPEELPHNECPHCATQWDGKGRTCPACLSTC